MDLIANNIVTWLKDPRNYKTTFKYISYYMSPEEKEYALKIIDDIRKKGLISKEFEVEGSFVCYSKAGYAALMSVIMTEYLDND